MEAAAEYGEIKPFPLLGITDVSELRSKSLVFHDCCVDRAQAIDEIGHTIVHCVIDEKDTSQCNAVFRVMVANMVVSNKTLTNSRKFHELRKAFEREFPHDVCPKPKQLITAVKNEEMTQDPVTVFAMAMATNIHIGFVCGENSFWSIRADGDVWKCDVLMILAEDTEMFIWRAMHVCLHTWALKSEEDELHCSI